MSLLNFVAYIYSNRVTPQGLRSKRTENNRLRGSNTRHTKIRKDFAVDGRRRWNDFPRDWSWGWRKAV